MKKRRFIIIYLLTLSIICVLPYSLHAYSLVDSVQRVLHIVRSHPDKTVILNIFASFCTACKKEVPILNRIHKDFNQRVIIQGLSLDEQKETLTSFIKETNIQYPVSMLSRTTAQELGIEIIPQLFIYKNGVLIKHIIGLISYEELVHYIQ